MNTIYTTSAQAYPVDRSAFIAKVFAWFAAALGLSSVGVYSGMLLFATYPEIAMNPLVFYGAMILELILVFTTGFWENKKPMAYSLFSFFALLSGFTMAPVLTYAGATFGLALILKALVSSVAMFAAAGIFGWVTKKDVSSIGGLLSMGVIGLILASVLNIFLGSSVLELTVSGIGTVLFTAYTAYYVHAIKTKYPDNMALSAAIGLYLSFINLFMSILRLLMAFSSD